MAIKEIPVETPTIRRLRERPKRGYQFVLAEDELRSLRRAGLPPAAILAFQAIRGASRASSEDWVSVPHRTLEAFDFPQDWWRLNVRRLERAGIIECDRQPGKLRRYRLPSKP